MMTPDELQAFNEATNAVEEFKRALQKKADEKSIRLLLKQIDEGFVGGVKDLNGQLKETIGLLKDFIDTNNKTGEKIVSSIQDLTFSPNIKVEPKIDIPQSKINVQVPEIKIPTINVPKPEVTVNTPDIKFPEYPREMAVTGLAGLIKFIADAFKGIFQVEVQQSRDKPLNVILCDEKGNRYKAIGGGIMGAMVGGSGGGGGSANHRAMQPAIEEVSLTVQSTVYPYVIPAGTVRIDFRMRSTDYDVLYSWNNFSTYFTLPSGSVKTVAYVDLTGKTLYFKCADAASQTVEIETLKR